MLLSVNKVGNLISGVIGKKRYSVPFEHSLFAALQEQEQLFEMADTIEEAEAVIADAMSLTKRNVANEVEANTSGIHFDEKTQTFHLKEGDVISEQAVPKKLADIMIKMFEEGNTIQPLVRAWTLFLRNPNFTPDKAELFANYITTTALDDDDYEEYIAQGYSEAKATELATYSDVSITKQGLLVTNKYVDLLRENDHYEEEYQLNLLRDEESKAEDAHLIPPVMRSTGDKWYVNGELTHLVKVGHVHTLPSWSFVDCNDDHSCVKGAHLGGKRYIRGYNSPTSMLLDCLASPDKIGAFDRSGNGAVRMLEFMVLGANFAKNKGLYHTTDYAAKIEDDWATSRRLAIEESNAIIAKLKEAQQTIADLIAQAELGNLSSKDADEAIANLASAVAPKPQIVFTKTTESLEDVDIDDIYAEDEGEEEDEEIPEEYSCENCGEITEGDWQQTCPSCQEQQLKDIEDIDMSKYNLTITKYTRANEGDIEEKVTAFLKEINAEDHHNYSSFCEMLENGDEMDECVFIEEIELDEALTQYYEWELL